MDGSLWENALKLLRFDTSIDKFAYDSILCKMKAVYCDDDVLVLSARDEFSLSLVKGQVLGKTIQNAINTAAGMPVSVKFVLEGDEKATQASVSSEKKAIRNDVKPSEYNGLSPDYTFDNFVVGDCNRFAHASAVSVANKPGQKQRNPFYLWGNSGLGKTHLMVAIGNSIIEQYPEKRVIYTSCEQFTNAFVACIANKNYEAFRNKYRTVDVLLIDDIQFLIGKEGVQTEFFNTFEALINSGKQIVMTCDKAPSNLTELDNRLISRFQDGILFDVQPPDFETRKAIFLKKLENEKIDMPADVIDYVCENITSNIRQLNGAFNTLSSFITLNNGNITMNEAQSRVASFVSPNNKKFLTPEIIINAVSKYFALPQEKITSKLRSADIADARNIAMYICRDFLELKYEKIGSLFGNRKHSTVMHGCENVAENPELKEKAEEIIKLITE